MRYSIADRLLGHGKETSSSSWVNQLHRTVENMQTRRLVAQGEIAVHQHVSQTFTKRATMVIRAGRHRTRLFLRDRRSARSRIPQITVTNDETNRCFVE